MWVGGWVFFSNRVFSFYDFESPFYLHAITWSTCGRQLHVVYYEMTLHFSHDFSTMYVKDAFYIRR